MKQKMLTFFILVGFLTAVIAFILSSVIFKTPSDRSTKVPVVGNLTTTFPDIKNDPSYNTIFNKQALDPSVPLSTAAPSNNQPFNGSQ